ncbi:DUF2807 domain-containing protein [Tenacibaculum sp. 190524A02b]|uniref:DUF2807 domain-containing protein n=1 Tax=Tenacibaculum vairaonense TaxID=3137860 RepID=A0ABM9PSK3_9FLAO
MNRIFSLNRIAILLAFSALFVGCNENDTLNLPDDVDNNISIDTNTDTNSDNKSDCIKGEGTPVTKTLDIANFTGVNLVSVTDKLTIKQGATQKVVVTGHANVIEEINTEVTDNVWKIAFKDGCYENYELAIEVTVPTINTIATTGFGATVVEDFTNQENLSISLSGSGKLILNKFDGIKTLNVTFKGSGNLEAKQAISGVNEININVAGAGTYKGFNIEAKNVTVNSKGFSNIETTATENLNVTVSGSGVIRYKGTPKISKTGWASIIDAN